MSKLMWVVRAGRDAVYAQDFLQMKIVAIGWGLIGDIEAIHEREGIVELVRRSYPAYTNRQVAVNAGQIYRFREVKHRKGAMGAPEIRAFAGGLRYDNSGLYVSTGGFSREARYEADRANHHVALMDASDVSRGVIEHYDKMDAETRAMLPLRKIYWPV